MQYITEAQISPGELFEKLQKGNSGSVILHYAVVRKDVGDKTSSGIRFEPKGDVEPELKAIAGEMRGKWSIEDVLIIRRMGTLKVGDVISLVAVSAARSNDAFPACQYGMERLKKMTTIRKTEVFVN